MPLTALPCPVLAISQNKLDFRFTQGTSNSNMCARTPSGMWFFFDGEMAEWSKALPC